MLAMLLDGCSGFCWSTVYVAAIALGIKRKTYLIPALSICLNFSWEFWAVAERMFHGTARGESFFIQTAWLMLDVGVFVTLLLYGPRKGTRLCWRSLVGLTAALAIGYVLLFRKGRFLEWAFWDNTLMSGLFIRHYRKGNRGGVSLLIAAAKLLGTLCNTILEGIICKNLAALWLGGICLILDGYYLIELSVGRERDEES